MLHNKFLLEALACAKTRKGFCAPNPAVGAILVKDNQVIARGTHFAAGHPHAEVVACESLSTKEVENSTLYVTLEPCFHWGRTPPCCEFIVNKGIKKVVFSQLDPNPKVAGQGYQFLKDQGVDCLQIDLPEIQTFYESYCYWIQTKRPLVTYKLALSLDAKIADPQGGPVAITGKNANRYTHRQRLQADAVMTTAVTINRDNPSLNVRLGRRHIAKPLYILDTNLTLSPHAKIFKTAASLTLFHSEVNYEKIANYKKMGANLYQITRTEEGMSLFEIMQHIGKDGVHDLWIEAGSKLFSSLIHAQMVNKALLYIAPILLGPTAYPAFTQSMDLFNNSKSIRWFKLGKDVATEIKWHY